MVYADNCRALHGFRATVSCLKMAILNALCGCIFGTFRDKAQLLHSNMYYVIVTDRQ